MNHINSMKNLKNDHVNQLNNRSNQSFNNQQTVGKKTNKYIVNTGEKELTHESHLIHNENRKEFKI